MAENTTKIPCRLESVAIDGQLGGANQIYDDALQLFQNTINGLFYDHKDDSSIHVSQEDRDRWDNGGDIGKVAAILSFANFAGTPEQTTNPEWEYVLLDASSHILLGINHDHEVKAFVDLDGILEYVTSPDYGLIDVHNELTDHINDASAHISPDDVSKLAYISTFCTLNGEFEENPEWKSVILDASNHILLGINNDNELHLYATIDEIFDILESPKYSFIEMWDTLDTHVSDSSIHITQSERDAWNAAQANVQPDWNEDSSVSDAYIKNKPESLPASDVYEWAKAEAKPTYTNTEVGLGNVTNDAQVKRSEMGAASGVATLGEDGKVPASQLPGFVDDVLEYDSSTLFPVSGESGKIYIDKSDNNEYRWSGSIYVQISKSLVIGITTGTAFDGGVGHNHVNNSDIHVTSNDKSTWNGKQDPASTLGGYGITDAKIENGTITLGSNTITPVTDVSGKADKSSTVSNVSYDSTGKKITKTINGSTTDVVSASTIVIDGGGITQHQSVTDNNPTLSWGAKSKVATIGTTDINVTMPSNPNTDTKNTAGSTNNTNKLFLIGAQTQAANPQTYSRVDCYIDASGYVFSGGSKTMTFDDTLTADHIGVIIAIASLAESAGDVSVVTNPEYQWVVLDASSHILMGSKTDGSFYSAGVEVLTEALQIMVSSYSGQKSGTFDNRPSSPYVGQSYFCTDKTANGGSNNGIPIWYNGSGWVDAVGGTVS